MILKQQKNTLKKKVLDIGMQSKYNFTVHFTCALDTEVIKNVFASVKDFFLTKTLKLLYS